MNGKINIQISKELHDFLNTQFVKKGDTYDSILKKLLEKAWGVKVEAPKSGNPPQSL